ncbi:N-acetylated-alpha-linked acidic dipeptidase-like protein 2 [Zopfia rhizophila CBS 207.26]|uniref:N-acetylated-alpha-linked acidic dipeptidase-like protein 2 n=1 Tax=Zopfia rhizophila CBS 207.26 TaxID=1314779 RepID=A0A6A6EX65_9PEZI|nr:N-acetylated-alpha-linked acidic dipeptidase-like protein 2 [Zopfia rhizophila CBS 207.26]
MKLSQILIVAIGARACQREHIFRNHNRHIKRQNYNTTFPPVLDQNEQILVDSFDSSSISTWSYYYTHGRHVAGENKTMAQWTAGRWAEYGFTSRLEEYYVYLNYPVHHSLQLNYANGSTYTPILQEDVLAVDDTTNYPNRVPAFHGYSFSGNASAEYVYVGRGQQVDFNRLQALGVELEGKIALAKYGGPFRGLKVKNAQEHGMIGAVIFTDPGDDGNVTEAKGVAAYPNGPARNPTSIQRGSVQFLSIYPGDPTTPGYPSKKDSPRAEKSNIVPSIPSLPISWIEAQPLLQALDSYGTVGQAVNRTGWVGAIPNVTYSTGPAPGTTLSLSNILEDKITWIWDVIGIINGTNEDEVVIVGNHRDAWMVGGAADPNSGSAVLVELAKAFGNLLKTGWKPKRTIVLASWDAEEYGLVGSTEWVEEYIPWLKGTAVSYLNIDVGVSGTIPDFSASPDLHSVTTSIAKKIVWPYRGTTNRTLYDVWEEEGGEIGVLGSGSDYTSFLHRGIGAIDLGTTRGANDPIYHSHSNYDSYHWMANFGDPGFLTHKAIGQYLTLFLYHLANDASLPLEPANYGPELHTYFEELDETIASSNGTLDLTELSDAIVTFEDSAQQFNTLRGRALSSNDSDLLTTANHKARDFSRGFASQGGLPGREFFQNLIFAPGLDTGYAPTTFPGITESVTAGNFILAEKYVGKTAKAILAAASILKT